MKKFLLTSIILSAVISCGFIDYNFDYDYFDYDSHMNYDAIKEYYLFSGSHYTDQSRVYIKIRGDRAYLEIDGHVVENLRRNIYSSTGDIFVSSDGFVTLEIRSYYGITEAYITRYGHTRVYVDKQSYDYNNNNYYDYDNFDNYYYFDDYYHYHNNKSKRIIKNYTSKYGSSRLIIITSNNTAFIRIDGEEILGLRKTSENVYENEYARIKLIGNKAYVFLGSKKMEFFLSDTKIR